MLGHGHDSGSGEEAAAQTLGYGLERVDDAANYYEWLADLLRPHLRGRVLEHGSGTGTLSRLLLEGGVAPLVLTDPDARLAALLADAFRGRSDVEVFKGTLEEFLDFAGAGTVDTVLSSNVLEHLEDDEGCLRAAWRVLRPGGVLALYVPARPELYGPHDREVGHMRRYRRKELRHKLVAAGFHVCTLQYRNLIGALGWWLLSRVLRKTEFESGEVRFYDRVVFPVCRRIENVVPPPYGQNLLALAVKPV